jgi:class 3 adenylate cyclase
MALDMLEAMRSSDEVGPPGLELRIGINSGPVVAGVIGRSGSSTTCGATP